ncbi:MAG: hypothetical protein HZC18_04245 [Candidatus Omnitrophica bacterium]|nr:hypothetical protein [Candidatus Omnitrophota bacterium]
MDNNVPLLTASRSADQKDGLLFAFERVMISSLDQEKTGALTSYYMKTFGIKTVHEDDFKKEIFHLSQGNPRIIQQLCSLARDAKYQREGLVNTKLMDLDRRISEALHDQV